MRRLLLALLSAAFTSIVLAGSTLPQLGSPVAYGTVTILIGADQTASSVSFAPGGTPLLVYQSFTATGSGTLATISIDWGNTASGSAAILAIYNSAGTSLLGQTSSFTSANGVQTESLQAGVSVSNGTAYLLAIYLDNSAVHMNGNGGTSATAYTVTSGTWPTVPTTVSGASHGSNQILALWGSN